MIVKDLITKSTVNLVDFEKLCANSEIINYNDKMIEIPNVVMLMDGNKLTLADKLLNHDLTNLSVLDIGQSVEELKKYIETFIANNDTIVLDSRTKPKKNIIINLKKLKENFILSSSEDDTLIINGYFFTNNAPEFFGNSLLTVRKVFYTSYEDMTKIKNYMLN